MKFLKQVTYIRYVTAKLSKFVQISMLTSTEFSLQTILWKLKRVWDYFPGHIFDKNFILQYYIKWPNLITRLWLLPKLFNNVCFVLHALAFDDVMILNI